MKKPKKKKKLTEWYLEPWAMSLGRPLSTTRYRKKLPSRRGYRGSHAKRHYGPGSRGGSTLR